MTQISGPETIARAAVMDVERALEASVRVGRPYLRLEITDRSHLDRPMVEAGYPAAGWKRPVIAAHLELYLALVGREIRGRAAGQVA